MNNHKVIKHKKERIFFRVSENGLIFADNYAHSRFKARSYHLGDIVSVDISKLRTKGLNKFAHKIGQLVIKNIDDFHGMEAHKALKRLQLEADAACEDIRINMGGVEVDVKIPKSFSFDSMDEGEYQEAIKKICNHIVNVYWRHSTPEEIEKMAYQYVEAA